MKARHLLAAILFAALPASADTLPAAQVTTVIEFYNQSLDHYFITTDPKEAADLDNGVHVGWARTGFTFQAIVAGQNVAGSVPICRFYGSPQKGLDSHFYSANVAECAAVQAQFADSWLLESQEVFRALPVDPNTGKCPSDNEQIFRLWNKRSDVNHRYTDQPTIYAQMVAKGYVAEGNGNPAQPVIFCMPLKSGAGGGGGLAPPGTPSCTLSSSSSNPLLGAPITLTATCTNTPMSFQWTNCTSTTSTCIANASVAGTVTYSVVGSNVVGAGNTASIDVNWTSSGGPIPICTLSASSSSPPAGGGVTLTANCSQSPSSFSWMTCNYMIQDACNFIGSCPSSSKTCTTNQSVAGAAHYALEATNSAGKSARVGIDIDWSGGGGGNPPPSAPSCTLFASNSTPTINSSIVLSASCSGNPTSYAWTNCNSTGASCNATASTPGTVTYQVVASNSTGNSAPATVQVQWQNPAPPACSVTASNTTPMAGTNITLTANCSGAPTNYVWTGCTSSTSTCQATNANAGAVVYSVAGVNGSGSGPQASVTVNWQPRPTSPPVCSVTSSNNAPFTGQTITLTATCTNSPQSYTWTNCVSSTSSCQATSNTAGAQSYSVTATNVVGAGAAASVTVNWQQSSAPPDFCGQYSDVVRVGETWGGGPLLPADYGGAFRANMVLVVAINVPASPTSYGSPAFAASVAEYQGPPTGRQATLSPSPCDFRNNIDPSGQSGPIAIGYGNTATVSSSAGNGLPMIPGRTYYINVRNYIPGFGLSCLQSTCNAIIGGLTWPH